MSLVKVTSPAAAACASTRDGATTPTIAGSSTAAPIVSFQPILLAPCIAHPPSGLPQSNSYYRRQPSGLTITARHSSTEDSLVLRALCSGELLTARRTRCGSIDGHFC